MIQGCGAAVFALAFSIVRDELPPARVSGAIATISGLVGAGGGLGLLVAGPIVETFSYHWLFWLPLAVTAAIAIAMVLFVPESPVRTAGKIHYTGAALLSLWLTCLLLGISNGATWGWADPRVLGLFAAAADLPPGLGVCRIADARATDRPSPDAPAWRLDCQRCRFPDQRRDVHGVHPDPALRRESRSQVGSGSAQPSRRPASSYCRRP